MRAIKIWTMAFLGVIVMTTQVCGGDWTTGQFLYKPALGARGQAEKAQFDSGLDKVDARLGKEIWVGDPGYGSTLQAAVTAIGDNNAILRVPAGTCNIAADLTIPANITLKPERGSILAIATGRTLTINGGLEAGPYQIFTWTGTGKVVLGGQFYQAYVEWWGAAGDGIVDDTATFNAALAATTSPIQLLSRTYLVSDLNITSSHYHYLHGAGMGKTILQAKAGATYLLNYSLSFYNTVKDMTLRPVAGMTGIIHGSALSYSDFRNLELGFAADPGTDNGIHGVIIEGSPAGGSYDNRFDHLNIWYLSGRGIYLKNASGDIDRTNLNMFSHCWLVGATVSGVYTGTGIYLEGGCANRFDNCYAERCSTALNLALIPGTSDKAPTGNYIDIYPDPNNSAITIDSHCAGNYISALNNTGVGHSARKITNTVFMDRYNFSIGPSPTGDPNFWSYSNFAQVGGVWQFFKDTTETKPRFQVFPDGTCYFGSGSAVPDTYFYRYGAKKLATDQQFVAVDGLATKVNAGAVDDTKFLTTPLNGHLAVDTTNGRLYFRYGGAWHYCAQTAGFEINAQDAYDHLVGPEAKFKQGDIVLGIVTGFKADGAPHCEYVTLETALKKLGWKR